MLHASPSPLYDPTWSRREVGFGRTLALRAAFLLLFGSITVGQRFGVNFGSYSLNLALPAMYALLLSAAFGGVLLVTLERLFLYVVCVAIGLGSLMINSRDASLASLLLLVAQYLPFAFALRSEALGSRGRQWVVDAFMDVALFCALAGICQFYAQFLLHADWLFDFTPYLPEVLRGPSGFNTVISVGSLHKSNGFFFREPSGFSFIMALGLIVESGARRRFWRLGCMGLALLLTYSGTGLLALFIGLLFPLGAKTVLRLTLVGLVAGVVLWGLGDTLNLGFTLGRVGEFASERSSAYIRYIAPARLLQDTFDTETWTLWFGHGPGTISHASPGYEFHDPTWAKLMFEYGALGTLAVLALFFTTLRRADVSAPIRATLFFGWLIMGGHLLSPEQNFLTLALVSLLPLEPALAQRKADAPANVATLVRLEALPRTP